MHIKINKKYLTYRNFKVKCAVGKRGIGIKKKEGDLKTPKGTFKVKEILFRKDRLINIKTGIKKTIIGKDMGWCDDPESKNYNKLIKNRDKIKSEKLYRSDNIYDIIIVLDYNMRPVRKFKGSAIFIHIAKKNFSSTKGCIAIGKKEIKNLLKFLDKKTKIRIV